tara:strand:- start:1205 stop:1852 length:648 start_codon:yes stop_codon:yes gene_type:complete
VNEALIISNVILWVVVVVLTTLLFAITRQVGILHERVAPAGALQPTSGPKIGEITEEIKATSLQGGSIRLGGSRQEEQASFILFISPTCPVCKELVPTAKSLAKAESNDMKLFFASDGENIEQHENYIHDLDIKNYPYVVSQSLGMYYQVSKLPFAVLIDGDGILRSKGLVNTREHLESLIESMTTGIATVQEYVESKSEPLESKTKLSTAENMS